MNLRPLTSLLLQAVLLFGAGAPLLVRREAPEETPTCSCLVPMDCCRHGRCHMHEHRPAAGGAFTACAGAKPDGAGLLAPPPALPPAAVELPAPAPGGRVASSRTLSEKAAGDAPQPPPPRAAA